MNIRRLIIPAIICAALSMPVGGFVFGFVHAEDAGFNLVARGFIGIVFMFLTPICFGFPPKNEGGVGDPFNAWPYIIICGLLMFGVWAAFIHRKGSQKI
jgi:hypothetical protein